MTDDANPYQPPTTEPPGSFRWSFRHRLAVAGGTFGGAIPVAIAVWILVSKGSPHPPRLDIGYFGTTSILGLILMLLFSPVPAVVLATVGGLQGVLVDLVRSRNAERRKANKGSDP